MRRHQATFPSLPRNAPALILAVAAAASIVVLLTICSGMTFFQDEWHFMIHRQGFNADAFFLPNDVHPVPVPAAIYKLCLAIFGMTSVGPERVIAVLLYTGTAILLFLYARRRIGDWLALFPAILLLFLGPAWNVLLWPFEMTLVGSIAAGLGALLALERDDRAGDLLACLLLVLATGCSSLGVSFALAAGVDALIRRRTRGLARLYVAAVPLALFAVWYLTYGHEVPSALSLTNVAGTPLYAAEGIASSLASLVGLSTLQVGAEGGGSPDWGQPLLVAVVVLSAFWLRRRNQVSPQIWVVVTAAASFWVLGGFNFIPGREATASRYQYLGAIFIVLILAEVFRGARLKDGRTILVLGGLTAVALLSNLAPLKDGHTFVEQQSELARGELAAIEIARDTVDPSFALTPEIAGTATLVPIDAGSYLSAVDAHGSPAEKAAELPTAPAMVRKQVDVVLANALPVELGRAGAEAAQPPSGSPPVAQIAYAGVSTRGSCLRIAAGAGAQGVAITLAGSTVFRVAPGPEAEIGLRRYGDEFAVESSLAGASASLLSIPPDRSEVPWQAQLSGAQAIVACTHQPSPSGAG